MDILFYWENIQRCLKMLWSEDTPNIEVTGLQNEFPANAS